MSRAGRTTTTDDPNRRCEVDGLGCAHPLRTVVRVTNGSMLTDAEFRAAMRPLSVSLRDFASSIRDQPEMHGCLPSPDSRAMAELASEKRWSTPQWLEPVRNAHSYGGMVTYLIAEHLSAYAAIIESAVVGPRYGHMPTVRAVIEAVPIAHWLLDPSMGVETRLRRSIAYRLTPPISRSAWCGSRARLSRHNETSQPAVRTRPHNCGRSRAAGHDAAGGVQHS
jgi:hypothetical protein